MRKWALTYPAGCYCSLEFTILADCSCFIPIIFFTYNGVWETKRYNIHHENSPWKSYPIFRLSYKLKCLIVINTSYCLLAGRGAKKIAMRPDNKGEENIASKIKREGTGERVLLAFIVRLHRNFPLPDSHYQSLEQAASQTDFEERSQSPCNPY